MAEEDVKIRLTLETSEARRQLERFKGDLRDVGDAGDDALQRARQNFRDQARATAGVVAEGAIGGLAQAGAGGPEAFIAGIRSLQAALPALGATFAQAQGIPAPVGALGGKLAAVGLERQFGPEFEAREKAIATTRGIFASRAAQGVEITPEQLENVFRRAMVLAQREVNLEAAVRDAAGGGPFP